jgi:hypothetical protein
MNVEVEVFSDVVGLLVGRECVLAEPTHTLSPLTNQPQLRTLPPPHSFDGLLMMGIVMPATC